MSKPGPPPADSAPRCIRYRNGKVRLAIGACGARECRRYEQCGERYEQALDKENLVVLQDGPPVCGIGSNCRCSENI